MPIETAKHDNEAEAIASQFVKAYAAADHAHMKKLLAESIVSYITNAKGEADIIHGKDALMKRIGQSDVAGIKPLLTVTQMLTVKSGQVLFMVEIKAQHDKKTLHNHGAFLLDIENKQITAIRMVDALPAYSDEFWKT
ncbi:MAG: hypothetical protein A3E83_09105 [Gammaproteobacteria bacterium RIFCSPHIGHO2_12_FULL_41_20]|nr:MAG: hypothetical protein A3E83_09105 [Gammaproteobacteria bacterium RIFCSPHIGHO2_12_FULL_41_20]